MTVNGEKVATYVIAACALVLTVVVIRRELSSPSGERGVAAQPTKISNWTSVTEAGWDLGAPSGPVTLVEFSDFQCPFCGEFARTLDSLKALYPETLRIRYRHYPIERLHSRARQAALAAECSGQQGRFQAFHDLLFANQAAIDSLRWAEAATRAGVADTQLLNTCMEAPETLRRISDDMDVAVAAGLEGTPTVIINGWRLPGTPSLRQVAIVINAELNGEEH